MNHLNVHSASVLELELEFLEHEGRGLGGTEGVAKASPVRPLPGTASKSDC